MERKPKLIITAPSKLNAAPSSVKPKSPAPRLARFICFLYQSILSGQKLAPSLPLHLHQPAFLVMYVEKLLEITQCPLPTVMLALHYIEKAHDPKENTSMTGADQLRFFAIACMLAQKFTDDHPYTNKIWAKVLGIETELITKGERDFLITLDFNLHMSLQVYASFCHQVQTLAKKWNHFIVSQRSPASNSQHTTCSALSAPFTPLTANSNSWMTPVSPLTPSPKTAGPMTPSTCIPIILKKIEKRIQSIPPGFSALPMSQVNNAFPFDQLILSPPVNPLSSSPKTGQSSIKNTTPRTSHSGENNSHYFTCDSALNSLYPNSASTMTPISSTFTTSTSFRAPSTLCVNRLNHHQETFLSPSNKELKTPNSPELKPQPVIKT